jgi:hypothetical protein
MNVSINGSPLLPATFLCVPEYFDAPTHHFRGEGTARSPSPRAKTMSAFAPG